MQLLKITLLLSAFSIFSQHSKAQQKEVFFNASILSQPDDFYFSMPHNGELSTFPATQVNIGLRHFFNNDRLAWEAALSFQTVQAKYTENFASTNDPAIPNELTFKYISNLLGVKGGIGDNWQLKKGAQSFSSSIGGSLYLPFLSKSKSRADDKAWNQNPMYTKDEFKYGVFYGVYFNASYAFSLGQSSPWNLNIFGEANLLWRNAVDLGNPLFMAGGGLGVSYTLR